MCAASKSREMHSMQDLLSPVGHARSAAPEDVVGRGREGRGPAAWQGGGMAVEGKRYTAREGEDSEGRGVAE